MTYDVVIAGAGPAGLSAALILGRARKRVLLCDSTPARNAAAEHIHGFVSRDGTPPDEFRRISREQLRPYESVEVRDAPVSAVSGELGAFTAQVGAARVETRRVLLCTGVIDEVPDLPNYRALWGKAIFQCPFCHGFEVRDRPFGYLAPHAAFLEFGLFLRGWTDDVMVFTDARFAVPSEAREKLAHAGVGLEERAIVGLVPASEAEPRIGLRAVALADGTHVPREVLFVRPPQRQTALVQSMGLALDEQGFVRVNEMQETTRPGIFAGGDLTTMFQGALLGAAAGAKAAYMMVHGLTLERFGAGAGH